MTVFVTQPRGYQVPVGRRRRRPQFFYNHLPEGSPELKYGGIAPTGALPDKVNFPLAKSQLTQSPEQHCAIGADVQTYNQKEVEFARNGVFTDLAATDYAGCGALFIGDIVGDDLSLFGPTRELTAMLNGPARFLPGNHDLDFDALDGEHEFDAYRSQFGPEYYSYDAGKAHVVALSNIEYPTTIPAKKGSYTYALGERQLEWLRADIAKVPKDKVIVLAGHSPLLEFFYSDSHTVKQLEEIYGILEGREVVSLGGHTHMSENLRQGDLMAGWRRGRRRRPALHPPDRPGRIRPLVRRTRSLKRATPPRCSVTAPLPASSPWTSRTPRSRNASASAAATKPSRWRWA